MIVRARVVVTMDGPPIEDGAVAVSGNRIVDVGTFDVVKARNSGEVVDLGEQAVLPGLINAHCHLDYTCLRGKIPPQKSFTDWIRAINAAKSKLLPKDYVASINEGFAEAKRFGTTTIANLTAFPELIPQIDEPIRTWWFAELIDVRNPERANEIDDSPPGSSPSRAARLRRSAPAGSVVDLAVKWLKSKEHWGLAPHAPFTASANLYRRGEEIARRENILLTTHLAESRDEMSMFCDASGPLHEFLREIGRDMNDCGNETPLSRFLKIVRDCARSSPGSLAATSRLRRPCRSSYSLHSSTSVGMTDRWMLVHLNELSESDFGLLAGAASAKAATAARSTTNFHVVHCPCSHKYFGHSRFQFEKLRKLGFNVCLGTDSLASNDDLSLFAEMRAFQKEFPDVPPERILEMVTVNSARALRQENALGKIRSGCHADLIAIPCARRSESVRGRTRSSTNVFEEIVAFDGSVDWSMIERGYPKIA